MFACAVLGITVALLCATPGIAGPQNTIVKAAYGEPTGRYDHGVLGDDIEWGALLLTVDPCSGCENPAPRRLTIRLPENRVFEDVAPRLVDLGQGLPPKVMVVESDIDRGARLAIYDETGLVTATPFIGRTHRWLAPIGAADLDGDGTVEIAYVDRPHLARLIRVWRFQDGQLELAGELPGFTNHRIGETDIAGGIRACGKAPEMIVADAGWGQVVSVSFVNQRFSTNLLGPHKGRASFAQAMECEPLE